VGYLPENYFYDYLTGWEFCRWQVDYSKSQLLCSANAFPAIRISRLSCLPVKAAAPVFKGMLQRVGMAQALINDPELFLDEPMSGLDPLGRHQMRRLFSCFKTRQDDFFQ